MSDADNEADERPWTEAQWEAFMKEGELRSARFSELFETLLDDPDRDAKISREMGWDEPPGSEEDEPAWMHANLVVYERGR